MGVMAVGVVAVVDILWLVVVPLMIMGGGDNILF